MPHSKKIWRVAWATLALHVTFAAISWFNLPNRIPTHFGISGTPDAWSMRSFFGWFVLVGVSIFLQFLIYALSSARLSETWNIPEKERFEQLTREQQQPVFKLMRIFGGLSAACVTLTMLTLHIGMYLTARGITSGLPWYIHVGMFAPIVCMLAAMIPWSKAVGRAILGASRQSI